MVPPVPTLLIEPNGRRESGSVDPPRSAENSWFWSGVRRARPSWSVLAHCNKAVATPPCQTNTQPTICEVLIVHQSARRVPTNLKHRRFRDPPNLRGEAAGTVRIPRAVRPHRRPIPVLVELAVERVVAPRLPSTVAGIVTVPGRTTLSRCLICCFPSQPPDRLRRAVVTVGAAGPVAARSAVSRQPTRLAAYRENARPSVDAVTSRMGACAW